MSKSTACNDFLGYFSRCDDCSSSRRRLRAIRNRGAILIVLLVGLLAVSSSLLLGLAEANRQKQIHQQKTEETLAFAKESLIAFAVNYADNYGHNIRGGSGRLPCPARGRHSGPGLSCGKGKTAYLPALWSRGKKRIDIDHVEKFLDQDLWYSVSPAFRYNPSYNELNPDAKTDLISIGSVDDIVAVIIAPGPELPGQNRTDGHADITDYLEGENADQDLEFSIAGFEAHGRANPVPAAVGNDQLIWITYSDLMPLVEKRVLGYVKQWLGEYYLRYGHYPYAAPFDDKDGACQSGLLAGRLPMAKGNCVHDTLGEFVSDSVAKSRTLEEIWFTGSRWPDYIYYRVAAACSPDGTADECISLPAELVIGDMEASVLLVSAGEAVESNAIGRMQERLSDQRALLEYFELPVLLSGDSVLAFDRVADDSNDQYAVIQRPKLQAGQL